MKKVENIIITDLQLIFPKKFLKDYDLDLIVI